MSIDTRLTAVEVDLLGFKLLMEERDKRYAQLAQSQSSAVAKAETAASTLLGETIRTGTARGSGMKEVIGYVIAAGTIIVSVIIGLLRH